VFGTACKPLVTEFHETDLDPHEPMKQMIGRSLIAILFLAGPVAVPGFAETDVEDVTNYLHSVRKHLLDSYVFGERLTRKDLAQAGKRTVMDRLQSDDHSPVSRSRVRSHLLSAFREKAVTSVSDLTDVLHNAVETFDPSSVPLIQVADVIAEGMIRSSGDPYSKIMTVQDLNEMRKRLLGEGSGKSLGLQVRFRDGAYRIIYVQYRTAADRAGLRAGDRIISIDGVRLRQGLPPSKRRDLLEADLGRTVRMNVKRPGWDRSHEFTLIQAYPGTDLVESKLLPDDVGYVRLTRFGLTATSRLSSTLSDLQNRGMDSLVFDLRNNPGGALPVAVDVADLFVDDEKVIAKTDMKLELNSRMLRLIRRFLGFGPLSGNRRAGTDTPFEELPMAVLVNGSTASASELTAGALQDHGRATIIGQTTFGKGVGQAAIPLLNTVGFGSTSGLGFLGSLVPTRFLYLTVLKYQLPSGRSIHKTGLRPDLRIHPPVYPEEQIETLLALRRSDTLQSYVRKQVTAHRTTMRALARYDGFDEQRYPNFDQLFDTLRNGIDPDLSPSLVRRELRRSVRAYFNRLAVRFTVDLQNDPILQAGILHLTE